MTVTSPFTAQSTALEVVAGYDLSGQTALITGASSGLGSETARALISAGATVILAVRDLSRGEALARTLRASHPGGQVHLLELDLASLTSVQRAAKQVLDRWTHLEILINNAGVMATPSGRTRDGFETQFGTNHLGHALLTMLLLPALRAAAPARVVVLSSSGHWRSDVQFDDLHYAVRPYDKWTAYGQSKTANALFAVGFTSRFAQDGLTANALHPGGIHTGLQQHVSADEWRALGWIDDQGKANPLFKTVEQGAATSVWAAVGRELDGLGGLYLENCQEALPADPARPGV